MNEPQSHEFKFYMYIGENGSLLMFKEIYRILFLKIYSYRFYLVYNIEIIEFSSWSTPH